MLESGLVSVELICISLKKPASRCAEKKISGHSSHNRRAYTKIHYLIFNRIQTFQNASMCKVTLKSIYILSEKNKNHAFRIHLLL